MKLKVKDIAKLEIDNNNLKDQFKSFAKDLESENNKLKEEVIEKNDELKKLWTRKLVFKKT